VGDDWSVPEPLVARMSAQPNTAAWVAGLPGLAEQLAAEWQLARDGAPWSGFLSAVWPVRTPAGLPLVLKVGYPDPKTRSEAAALRAWTGRGTVRCLADDPDRQALLLERLDGDRSLETHPDVDAACAWIADLLARVHQVAPLPGLRTVAGEAVELAEQIETAAAQHRGMLPVRSVDQALATLADLAAPGADVWMLHADCHFLNVLPTLDGAGWRAIDPLPTAGPREWELLALLRNRWADAAAGGDPDAALGRRVDQVCEVLGADAAYARRLAQAASVFMLLELLPTEPTHFFVPPHQLMLGWT
jgi:streptomycin 6-kinase